MNPSIPQLNCLVLAPKVRHHQVVSAWLGVSKRLGDVTVVQDEDNLCQQLSETDHCHLCIIVVESPDDILPACTLRYPDMRLLVLTANRRSGKFTHWLQQGATDVVTMKDSEAAQHAISRLIDECVADLQQDSLKNRIEQLEHEASFLKSILQKQKRTFVVAASNDSLHKDDNPTITEQLESDLNCVEQPEMKDIVAKQNLSEANDNASVVDRFQELMQTEIKAPRFTAMLVRIADENDGSGDDKNQEGFSLIRAVDKLQKQLVKGTIFGRVNKNALLLIQSSDIEPVSREAANRVRKTLGSIGGDDVSEKDIHINTMTLPAKTRISVDEMVARLEAHG